MVAWYGVVMVVYGDLVDIAMMTVMMSNVVSTVNGYGWGMEVIFLRNSFCMMLCVVVTLLLELRG